MVPRYISDGENKLVIPRNDDIVFVIMIFIALEMQKAIHTGNRKNKTISVLASIQIQD